MSLRIFVPVILIGLSAAFGPNARGQTATSFTESPPTAATEPIKNETVKPMVKAAVWPDFQKAFEAGVSAYQGKKYDEARLAFSAALEMQPNNVEAMTNLALVQFQLGQKGVAVALLRKAQSLDTHFSTPQTALQFILPQMDVKEIPHEIQMWESFRSSFIVPFSLNSFLALAAITFFASGWLLLGYFGKRREALRSEKSLPAFPLLPSFFAFLFVVMFSLAFLKVLDAQMPRGTVIKDKVTVYSAPNEKSVALFDLFSGLEVTLDTVDEQWVQVTYPGAQTGWIQKSSVLQTSGRDLW